MKTHTTDTIYHAIFATVRASETMGMPHAAIESWNIFYKVEASIKTATDDDAFLAEVESYLNNRLIEVQNELELAYQNAATDRLHLRVCLEKEQAVIAALNAYNAFYERDEIDFSEGWDD